MQVFYRSATHYILSNMYSPYTRLVPLCKSMTKTNTHIIVFGASGRMGSRLCTLASADPSCTLLAAVVRDDSPRIDQPVRETSATAPTFTNAVFCGKFRDIPRTVIVDFSSDAGVLRARALALDINASLLVGTTALSPSTVAALHAASEKISLLITPNTSIGVAALSAAVAAIARTLGPDFDCSIVEAHHAMKKDAPSGTAIRLARAAREAGASLPDNQVVALRGGDVVGEHTVRFAGAGEYIELTHRATSRDLFARGALRAAAWLAQQPPGSYTMDDVLRVNA